MNFITWLFERLDNKSDYEKQEQRKLVESLKRLGKTHHIRVGNRGGVSIIRKDSNG
jgi:hypothetical protein